MATIQLNPTNLKFKSFRRLFFNNISLLLFVLASLSSVSFAEDIEIKPIKYYTNGISATSIQEVLEAMNKRAQKGFEACTAPGAYSGCGEYNYISADRNEQFGLVNNEPQVYAVTAIVTNHAKRANEQDVIKWVSQGVESSITTVTECGPSLVTKVEYGSSNGRRTRDQTVSCLLRDTPQSCPIVGNPVVVGTGDKQEFETDYSTADGLLRVERIYQNQFSGWLIDDLAHLGYIPQGGIGRLHQGNGNQLVRYAGDDIVLTKYTFDDPSNLNKTVAYVVPYPYEYMGYSDKDAIFLWLNDRMYRFYGANGTFVGDGAFAKQLKIIRLENPVVENEYWELVDASGAKSYFSQKGRLLRKELSSGGWLSYTYENDKLITKSDYLGRTLHYQYDSFDRLEKILLPDSGEITYEYGHDASAADFYLLHKVTFADGQSVTYLYNEAGLVNSSKAAKFALTGKLDSYGNRIGTYKYNSNKAVSTERALGVEKRTIQTYPTLSNVTDSLGNKITYYFNKVLPDGNKLLTAANQPGGSGCAAATKSASYYEDGLKKAETNFNGHKTQFAYDNERALETVRVEGVPAGNNVDYLPANALLIPGAKKITTQWHSQLRKPIKKAEPKLITSYVYNGDTDPFNENQLAACAPENLKLLCHKIVQATTDANGSQGFNAVMDQNYLPREEYYTYNQWGQQLSFARSAGAVDEIREYYPDTTANWTKGDLKSVTNALGQKTEFTHYDANGRILAFVDANGVETNLTYDARGRLLTQSLNGDTTTYHYDLNGNKTGIDLPNGVSITYLYDLAKRLTDIVDSTGNKISYEYDSEFNLKFQRIYNASGDLKYIKENVYDALSRVQQSLNSSSQGSTLLYDANGNLTGEIDAKQQQTTNTYNALDQLATSKNPLNGTTTFGYDGAGNLASVKDPKGNTTSYTYNPFGEIETQVSPDTGTTSYTYDEAGNRTSSTDARGVVANYHYDALNRLTSVEYPASPAENITYGYDATANGNLGVGHLTSIVTAKVRLDFEYNYQGLISKKYTQVANSFNTTSYRYDGVGNLSGITYPSGREVSYERDSTGRISAIKTKADAGAAEQTLVSAITYMPFGPVKDYVYGNGLSMISQYDQDYRLTHIDVGSVFNRDYGFDAVNNITNILDNLTTSNQVFGYDALNRLTSASGTYGDLGYTYDAVGNRLTETRNGVTDTYNYPATSNRLSSITRAQGNRDFAYDNAGNPTARTAEDGSSQTLSFNNANRLDSISVSGNLAATYTYNPLGQRVVKALANGSKEIYHYDEAGQLLAVMDGTGNTLREYIYRDNQQVAMVANGNIYYIHSDHLNTPQVITDANQQVVWMANYEPFGKLAANQTNSIEVYSRFPGQYLDSETGLYYNYFRDYDPSIGRYIESDPIGLWGGVNTYAYVGGNPISFADPYGLRTEVTIWHPAGWGGSSFGHVSTDINGTVYSYGRDGMWTGPASDYYAKNTFRDGQGVVVPLTPDQEKKVEACMKRDHGSYSATSNNCGSPIQDCLKESGIDTGDQMFPANVGMSLLDQGALPDANSSHPATSPSKGSSAPWAH